jgi:hypothetical protein
MELNFVQRDTISFLLMTTCGKPYKQSACTNRAGNRRTFLIQHVLDLKAEISSVPSSDELPGNSHLNQFLNEDIIVAMYETGLR